MGKLSVCVSQMVKFLKTKLCLYTLLKPKGQADSVTLLSFGLAPLEKIKMLQPGEYYVQMLG